MWSHLRFEAECCGVVLRCHVLVAVMGSGEPPVGKCVLAEVGNWYGESYGKREKDAVVSSQTRGAWNGARSMGFGISRQAWGALFYIRKFSGQRLFQTRQEFLVSFVATNHHFSPSRCVYFSLSPLQYIFNTTAGVILLKCGSDHIAPLLESFRIKFGPLTLAWEGFLT